MVLMCVKKTKPYIRHRVNHMYMLVDIPDYLVWVIPLLVLLLPGSITYMIMNTRRVLRVLESVHDLINHPPVAV